MRDSDYHSPHAESSQILPAQFPAPYPAVVAPAIVQPPLLGGVLTQPPQTDSF
jgi:hypothetical protein